MFTRFSLDTVFGYEYHNIESDTMSEDPRVPARHRRAQTGFRDVNNQIALLSHHIATEVELKDDLTA
jgi:hypothetical protein